MKKALAIFGGIVGVLGIACLVVWCIATAKDMTFVEFIKSWFPAKEVVDGATAMSRIMIGG